MRYKIIPRTGLKVSGICLGTADMDTPSFPSDNAIALLDRFVELGGNFLDTAHVYANWIPGTYCSSEKFIGRWLGMRRNRKKIVIATKGAHPALDDMKKSRMSQAEIGKDIDESLQFLGTDYIDLFYLHRDDPALPVAEIVGTLDGFVQAGKIRCFGCSNWREHRIAEALAYSQTTGSAGFVAVQNLWSLAWADMQWIPDRTLHHADPSIVHLCREKDVAAIPYSAQANGFFAKKAQAGQMMYDPSKKGTYECALNYARLRTAVRVARELGVSVTAVALAYVTSQDFTAVPAIGPKNIAQLDDCLSARDVKLTKKIVAALEKGEA